jgi:hypothetical protein
MRMRMSLAAVITGLVGSSVTVMVLMAVEESPATKIWLAADEIVGWLGLGASNHWNTKG